MAVYKLVVEALVTSNREAACQALLLDPLSAAVCLPAELSALVDEL